jgi:hypothetical protein
MSNSPNLNTNNNLENINKGYMPNTFSKKVLIKIAPQNLFIFAYLVIIAFSIEGIVTWSIGIFGIYRTLHLYRTKETKRHKKAAVLLLSLLIITIIYNLLLSNIIMYLSSILI